VLTRTKRLVAVALVATLMGALAAPVAADGLVDQIVGGLDDLTHRVEKVTLQADRRMNAGWDLAVAEAVDTASLNRIERALAIARVEAAEVLHPLIGSASTGAVPTAISMALFDEDMNFVERRDLSNTMTAWRDFRRAIADALALRNLIREQLGLPSVEGLRVCPLEHVDSFLHDWGDRRGWRTHKGTDINAARNDRLVAVERGVIIQTGWHYLGGNQVYLLGGVTGDVYYYAHMEAYADGIEVGVPVVAGQVVGYVGDTGNADVPHLHLGWMPQAGRVDLDGLTDPYPMLVELCL